MRFPRSALSAAACSLLGLTLLSLSSGAMAQTLLALADDNTVVVTATRQPTRIGSQLSDVSEITREDIEQTSGRTLAELLGQQPGLQFVANGGLGKSSSVSIRGAEVRHTLLIIDGVRYGSATLGQPTFENIPLEMIERVEIVRGPLSSLYGADAAGGVIQVFTRQGQQGLHPNARIGVGPHHYGEAGGGLAFGDGPWTGVVQVQHLEDRGFSSANGHALFNSFNSDDDGFRQNSATASVGYRFNADWQLGAHAMHSEGHTKYDDGAGGDATAKLTSDTLGADLTGRISSAWRSVLRVSQSFDAYNTLTNPDPSNLGEIHTRQQQASWENTIDTPIGSVLALAEHLRQQVHKPADDYEVTDRTINAVALGLNGHHEAHSWQASVRHDHNTQFGNQDTGNLAYGYDITPQWRVGASAGTSFVSPSFNQLYWPDFGNPDLLPERGRNREASLRWRPNDQHTVSLTAFSNRVRNYITADNDNVAMGKLDGATLAYQGQLDDWQLMGSIDQLNARNSETGAPLPRRAKHSLKLSADRRWGTVGAGASFVAHSHRYDTVGYDASFNPIIGELGGYAALDLRASWQFLPDFTLQANLNNVADRRYETAYGYNQPGREFYVTLRWAPR